MKRKCFLSKIQRAFRITPAVALLGPRQCGKTTLAKDYAQSLAGAGSVHYFDCENTRDLVKLTNPLLTLESLTGLIIIDEVQRVPELFPVLRGLIDADRRARQFLILGSASRTLLRQSSESLAGRISYLELTPFNLLEATEPKKLWVRGGFPESFLADSDEVSFDWRSAYVTTFLEMDIPNLGIQIPPATLRRFWMMLCHYHGNVFNASELGGSLGVSHTTARHYLDILTSTFMIRTLQPWLENIKKRQVKTPKIYFRDSGIYHNLLGLEDWAAIENHPKLGASWEGFALEELMRFHGATPQEAYFWGIHNQAELDLLIMKKGKRLGYELKYSDAPTLTRSMVKAMEILKLDELIVITPAEAHYPLEKNIRVQGLQSHLQGE